jgi:hypothetical protein
VNICLHRAPGYCSLDNQDPAIGVLGMGSLVHDNLSKIHITVEKTNLFHDPKALEAFAHQWAFFAQRYKGTPSEGLSFNLLNEPNPPMTRAERDALSASSKSGKTPSAIAAEGPSFHVPHSGGMAAPANPTGLFAIAEEISKERIEEYARVARVAIGAIRSIDQQRPIICDGDGGAIPVPDLIDSGVLQSRHAYDPEVLTLDHVEWRPQRGPGTTSSRLVLTPTSANSAETSSPANDLGAGFAKIGSSSKPIYTGHWPILDYRRRVLSERDNVEGARVLFGRDQIEVLMRPWKELEQQGVCIHFGETGCYKYTPHQTVLAWMKDTLEVMGKMHSGWALRNFRGPFGVLDTDRAGTKFEDWHGHQLDRALLTLLQKHLPA